VAINFPTSLDNFTNPSSGNTLDSPSHSLQHSDINDAVEALEAKLGVGASPAGSATSGQVLTAQGGGTALWATAVQGLTQIIPTSVTVGSGSGSVDANGAVTFSSASSVSFNGCFSSIYSNYRIIFDINTTTSAGFALLMRLRVAGSDNTTSNYHYGSTGGRTSGANYSFGAASTNTWVGMQLNNNNANHGSFDILYPQATNNTYYNGNVTGQDATSFYGGCVAGYFNATTSFDSLSLIVTSGAISGTARIYGYKK
jgi:hypothetical protein